MTVIPGMICSQDEQVDPYIDSLEQVISAASTSSSNSKEAFFLLGEYLVQRNPEKAEELALSLRSRPDVPSDSSEWARLNFILAASHRWQGNYSTALDLYDQNYLYFKRASDPLRMAKSGNYIGSINTFLGNNVLAQKHLLECAEVYDSLGSEQEKAGINSSLAGLYLNLDQVDNALDRYDRALKAYSAVGDSAGMALINCNLGLVYSEEGELELAEKHLQAMEPLTNVFPTLRERGFYHDFLGILRQKQGRLNHAYQEHLTALNIRSELSSTYNLCESLLNVGEVLTKLGRDREAIPHLQQVLSYEEHESLNQQSRAHWALAEAYENLGNYRSALTSYKAYDMVNDSIYNSENAEVIAEKDAQYQKREKDAEIALLNKEKEISLERLRRSQITTYGVLLGLILFSIFSFAIYRLYLKLREQNKIVQATLNDKNLLIHEIHHRVKNNLQVISSLLNLQSKFITDDNAMQAIKDGRNRVQSMALLHQDLYRENDLTGVNMQVYFTNLVRSIFKSYNLTEGDVSLSLQIDDISLDVDQVVPLGLITNELITNSLKYAFQNGKDDAEIHVSLKEGSDAYHLHVSDNGVGIDKALLEALPSRSFGQRMIHAFVTKLKASMDIDVTSGTSVRVVIPYTT